MNIQQPYTYFIQITKGRSTYVFLYDIYVTAKMDVLGKTVLPRQNGFAGRQIRFAWTDQAKWIWDYFRSYLFV